MGDLFDKYARRICRAIKLEYGTYTAAQMTYYVKQWPGPTQALALMKVDLDKLPIVFLDVPFEGIARWLLDLLKQEYVTWPVCLMPVNHVDDWQEDVQARTFAGYLAGNGMGLMITMEEDAVLCRGEWVRPCDFRVSFERSFVFD